VSAFLADLHRIDVDQLQSDVAAYVGRGKAYITADGSIRIARGVTLEAWLAQALGNLETHLRGVQALRLQEAQRRQRSGPWNH